MAVKNKQFFYKLFWVYPIKIFGKEIHLIRGQAWTFFCFIFIRDMKDFSKAAVYISHEKIHVAQMYDTLFIFAYLQYALEFIIKLPMYKFNAKKAYANISFEREAYQNQDDFTYLLRRKRFSHLWYL